MRRILMFGAGALLAAACGGEGRGDDRGSGSSNASLSTLSSADDGTASGDADGGPSGDASADGGPGGDGDDGPMKFDVANGGDGADDGILEDGCQKVDVIFAVDNSGSMSEEHQALQGPVFDSFPEALLDINNGIDDFQLAVIDACPKPANFHNYGDAGACNFSTGTNYMISSSPNLAAEYACVTTFPANGYNDQPDMCIDDGAFKDDDEQPGLTAAQGVSPASLAGANTGFIRDDAILFIVTMTDEDEEVLDVGSEQEIYNQIVAAKGGDVTKVVYMGVAGGSDCDGPYGSANDAARSRALTQLFIDQGQGLFWDLCQGNLEMAFQTAISTIVDDTCQGFEPPG